MKWFVTVLLAFGFCVVCRTYAGAVDQPNAFANPGLEGPYQPLPAPAANAKARITGAVADGWEDNSGWADVTVVYTEDRTKPHEGCSFPSWMVKSRRDAEVCQQTSRQWKLSRSAYATHRILDGKGSCLRLWKRIDCSEFLELLAEEAHYASQRVLLKVVGGKVKRFEMCLPSVLDVDRWGVSPI